MKKNDILTVSQLNRYIRYKLEEDQKLDGLLIRGEISNFVRHIKTGHLYFTLKDETSALKTVMFASYAQNLLFRPQDGMHVLIRGKVSVYEKDGTYQLYAYELIPDGIGEQYLAYEQLKRELESLGMTNPEKKKPIPKYPERIGIVTSPVGAALQDMIRILTRRYPLAQIVFCPAAVQGAGAARELVQAVRLLNLKEACDVILLGRGGGSAEDLSAFNDRELAFAVFESRIPVISAVGHETDFTICDLVADLRAPTPSAAAELVTPDQEQIFAALYKHRRILQDRIQDRLHTAQILLERHSDISRLAVLRSTVNGQQKELIRHSSELFHRIDRGISDRETRLFSHAQTLTALNPFAVLSRGYAAVFKNGNRITLASELSDEDEILLRFHDGSLTARILKREEEA